MLWEVECGSFITADDRSAFSTAQTRLSKSAPTSGSNFASLVKRLVAGLEASQAVSARTENGFEWQKRLFLKAESAKKNALNDVANFRGQAFAAGTRETELLSYASATSS